MRIAIALAVLAASVVLPGCCCNDGAQNDCAPKTKKCCTWQPDCCNTWDFYDPCDMIEGREYRKADACEPVPTCAPCK